MKENVINFLKKYPLWIIAILTIMIPLYLFSNGKLNKDFKIAKKVSKNINSTNETLNSAVKNSSLDTNLALDTLSDNMNNLLSIKNNLTTLKVSNKYLDTFNALETSLNSNLKLCEQAISLLKNPSAKDIDKSLDLLHSLLNDTKNNYSICSKHGLNVSLTKSGEDFYNSLQNYINELIKINRDSKINNSTNNEFIKTIEKHIDSFTPLVENLTPAIEKVREDKRDISVIIDDVNKKISSLEDLTKSFNSISVPANGLKYFKEFQTVLKSGELYLDELMESLKEEEAFNRVDYSKTNNAYKEAISKFQSFIDNYNKFINTQ